MFRNIASYEILWVDCSHISEIAKNSQTSQNRIAFLVRYTHYVCETGLGLFYLDLYSGYIDSISYCCDLIFSSIIVVYARTSL